MQPAKNIESKYTAVVIDFNAKKIEKESNELKKGNEEKPCFRTNHSYYCQDMSCSCRNECQKLIAAWLR